MTILLFNIKGYKTAMVEGSAIKIKYYFRYIILT